MPGGKEKHGVAYQRMFESILLTLHMVSLKRVDQDYKVWSDLLRPEDMTNLVLVPPALIHEVKTKGVREQYQILGQTVEYLYTQMKKFKGANISRDEFFFNYFTVSS